MILPNSHYKIYRSRNKGAFWGNITFGSNLNLEQAKELIESEHKKHPSDWLRLVKSEETLVLEYKKP